MRKGRILSRIGDPGKPAVNQTITFSIQTGSGTFNTSTSDGTALIGATCTANVCTVQTDADGKCVCDAEGKRRREVDGEQRGLVGDEVFQDAIFWPMGIQSVRGGDADAPRHSCFLRRCCGHDLFA